MLFPKMERKEPVDAFVSTHLKHLDKELVAHGDT